MKKNMKVKDEEFAKMKKVHSSSSKYVDKKFYFYFSYTIRVILMFIAIFILGIVSYLCFVDSFSDSKDVVLSYEEKGEVSYDVSLLLDNPFEEGTLNPVDSYISEVIDNIGTDFYYQYNLDKVVDVKYSYYIVATMELKNKINGVVLTKNEYNLMQKVNKVEKNVQQIEIKQNINLDYDWYNKLAQSIEEKYGIDVLGNLSMKMYIDLETNYEGFDKVIENEQALEVNIPLLSTEVSSDTVEAINNKDVYLEHANPKLINKVKLYIGILVLIIDTIFFLLAINFILRSTPKRSKYCTLRDGLLKDYDSIIVNSKNMPKFGDSNVIECYSFGELMDAQRLLDKPIIYYEIVKDQKSLFVIIGDNDVYKFTLKECDIDF